MSFATKSARNTAAVLIVALIAFGAAPGARAQSALPSATPLPVSSSPPASSSPSAPPLPEPSPSASPQALTAQPNQVFIAPGVSQAVKILGAAPPINATVSGPFATITMDQKNGFIYVSAVQIGAGVIHVTDANGASVDIPISVALPAGVVPPTLSLTVTGTPAGPRFLQREIQEALRRVIAPTLRPGAAITFNPLQIPLQPLQPGFVTTVDVPVTLWGTQNVSPVYATTTVSVSNMAVTPAVPGLLFYDDDPEYVPLPGVLFRGTVQPDGPARLYYYHDNLGLPKDIAVVLTPASSLPTRVQLIDVVGGPDLDVMAVGHNISKTFLFTEPRNEGIVTDLSPQTPFVLHSKMALAGELVAGIVDVHVLAGGPVNVTVVATPAGDPLPDYLNGAFAPRDGHNRSGVFNIAGFGIDTVAYTVGGPDAPYVYGGREKTPPNVDPSSPGHDWGDYGVIHHVTFDIDNPTGMPQTVYLYEKPTGWPTINSFIIDGQLKQMGCARAEQRYEITEYDVAPNAQQTSTIVTMTDGGSSYPLEIGLTQTPPLPNTPPVSDPDGCFPKATPSPSPSPVPLPSTVPTPTPPAGMPPQATPSPTPVPFMTLPPALQQ